MKKITLIFTAIVACSLLTLGTASAGSKAKANENANNGNGNQGCYVKETGETYKNPGEMFQAMRATDGDNPAETVAGKPAPTVGEWINRRCK